MRKSSSFKSDQIVLKKAFFPYDLNRENLFAFKSKHLGTYENLEINGLFIAKNKQSCEPYAINDFKSACYIQHIDVSSLMGSRGEYFWNSGAVW